MNLRRLKYFLKIVDLGSLTYASDVLHIAQPALSQQIATLEGEFGQRLLTRNKRGVLPTDAGRVLYRHAQVILKQFEQAKAEVDRTGSRLSGRVSVGMVPGTAAAALALPLLKTVREQHPDVVLHINENFGTTLCEQVANGCMDMAFLYGGRRMDAGLTFEPLQTESLYVVSTCDALGTGPELSLALLAGCDLLLPRTHNYLRRYIDDAFSSIGTVARVVAEIESATTLASAVASGVGVTVLPESAARTVACTSGGHLFKLTDPCIDIPLALCTSDRLPLSEPARTVREIVLDLVDRASAHYALAEAA
jgi:LysR family nitrogen assimilation transcriptional regulator